MGLGISHVGLRLRRRPALWGICLWWRVSLLLRIRHILFRYLLRHGLRLRLRFRLRFRFRLRLTKV